MHVSGLLERLNSKARSAKIKGYIGNIIVFLIFFSIIFFYQSKIYYGPLGLFLFISFLILLIFLISLYKIKVGFYIFIFLIPLVNTISTILQIRQVPILFLLFCSLYLAFIIDYCNKNYGIGWSLPKRYSIFDATLARMMLIFIIIFTFSLILSIIRYANFYPFFTNDFYNLKINVNGDNALTAIYQSLGSFFNLIIGFGIAVIVFNIMEDFKDILRAIGVLFASTLVSIFFIFYQYFFNPYLGSFPYWVESGRFNSTFSDPNALGAYTILIFPLFFAFIVYFKKWYLKIIFLGFLILLLFMTVLSGSRTALISMSISLLIFVIIGLIKYFKRPKKAQNIKISKLPGIISIVLIAVILLTIIFSFLFLFISEKVEDTFLIKLGAVERVYESFNTFIHYYKSAGFVEALKSISNFRYIYWGQAIAMANDYPLSGVGIGSYITLLPNYFIKNRVGFDRVDYTGNYYLQILSELGVIGLILIVVIFYFIAKRILLFYKNSKLLISKDKSIWIFTGLFASFISMLFALFFGPHTTFTEVQLTFWLIIGLGLVFIKATENRNYNEEVQNPGCRTLEISGARKNIYFGNPGRAGLSIFLILFVTSMVFSTLTSLSINVSQNLYDIKNKYGGWTNKYGFYNVEKYQSKNVRWTGIDASEVLDKNGSFLIIPMKNNMPEQYFEPISVTIYIDNYKVAKIKLEDSEWKEARVALPVFAKARFTLTLVMDNSWSPKELGINNDTRELGIFIGEYYYENQ